MSLDKQYQQMVRTVLQDGEIIKGRNGEVCQYFSPAPIVIDSVDEAFPILQLRKVPFYKACLETLFFLSGNTEFLDMPECLRNSWWRPWKNLAERSNSWGKFYGHQMRHSQAEIGEFDQWSNLRNSIYTSLVTGKVNRRLVISLWRPQDCDGAFTDNPAVLDSCHSTALVFNVNPKTRVLDLHHTQRSLDLMCGFPSDLIYSGLLMKLLAKEFNLKCGKLVFQPCNVHLYEAHYTGAEAIGAMKLPKFGNPQVTLHKDIQNYYYTDIDEIKLDIVLSNYQPLENNFEFQLVK